MKAVIIMLINIGLWWIFYFITDGSKSFNVLAILTCVVIGIYSLCNLLGDTKDEG